MTLCNPNVHVVMEFPIKGVILPTQVMQIKPKWELVYPSCHFNIASSVT